MNFWDDDRGYPVKRLGQYARARSFRSCRSIYMTKGAAHDTNHQFLLRDSEGNESAIRSVRGAEAGLDHLEVITQSPQERELGVSSRHRIYSEEI